jgi:transcriptional regulator with XRE-family HTH domain
MNNVRQYIDDHDIVQAKVAARLGMSRTDFHHKMNGTYGRQFTPDEQARLADIWGAEITYLFPEAAQEAIQESLA